MDPLHDQTQRNLEYYSRLSAGQTGYWRYMPAARSRRRMILSILRDLHPRSILDVGCGDGSFLMDVRAAMGDVALAGIDLSGPQIDVNRSALPDIDWYCRNVETEAVPEHQYEAIVASEIIEHLARPAEFLRSIRGMAVDGGLLVLSTQSGRIGATERHVGHLRHFSAGEMSELLRGAGWNPVRVWNAGFPFHDLSKWAANLSPDRAIRQFGEKPYGPFQRGVSLILRLLFAFNSRSRGAQLYAIARKVADSEA